MAPTSLPANSRIDNATLVRITPTRRSHECEETDYTLYYLRHGYFLALFGGLRSGIVRSAEKYREKNPGKPMRISWGPIPGSASFAIWTITTRPSVGFL
jgi:hypothetical protein